MARDLTGAFITAVSAGHVPCLLFVEMDFVSGYLRLCNAGYNFTWNGHTWLGLGYLGAIEEIREEAGPEAHGLSFQISGVPSDHVQKALGEHYQGRSVKVWFAPLNPDTYAVIADPKLIWEGLMDTMDIPEMGEKAVITITTESPMAAWDKPNVKRFNHQDQIQDYPDDKGFEFVEKATSGEVIWGPM